MRIRILLALFAALPLSAQSVGTIFPTSGPAAGKTYIHILGKNLIGLALLCPSRPCSNYVEIGGVDAPIVSNTKEEIVALVPAHAPGSVDVVVNIAGSTPFTIANGYRYEKADESETERLLLPIVIDAKGAFGSDWHTSMLIHNGSDETVTATGVCTPPFIIARCGLLPVIAPHKTITLEIVPDPKNPSSFIYLPRSHVHDVDVTIRVQDLSRQALTWGTSVPLVRADDFKRVVRLHDVPTDSRFRSALRIYAYDAVAKPVTLRVYDQTSGQLLVDTTLELDPPTFFADEPPPTPAYAQVGSLADAYTQLRGHEKVRVEVESAFVPQAPLWAFVAVTNNETQHVTVLSP